jgi:hypothetical protein
MFPFWEYYYSSSLVGRVRKSVVCLVMGCQLQKELFG